MCSEREADTSTCSFKVKAATLTNVACGLKNQNQIASPLPFTGEEVGPQTNTSM